MGPQGPQRWFAVAPERLRHFFAGLLATLVALTVIWMSSVGILSQPNLFLYKSIIWHSAKNTADAFFLANLSAIDVNLDDFNEIPSAGNNSQPIFTMDQKLLLINVFGPDGVDFDDPTLTTNNTILDLTTQRLRLRIDQRLAKAGQYAVRLNQTTPLTNQSLYVSHVIIDGGLGNWMFMVGSMFGVARTNLRRPSLLKTYWAEADFQDFSMEKKNRSQLFGNDTQTFFDDAVIGEAAAGKFTPSMTNVTAVKGPRNVILSGYLQSWRYFDLFRDDIRSMFTFSQEVFNASLHAIETKIAGFMGTAMGEGQIKELPTLVGIHVRRGDITNADQLKHGHRPATEEYLLRTALHFQRKYSSVLFIVISNDIAYCRHLYQEPNFLLMENNAEAVDIAILSLMDHIILSVGTYGWWGAYLSDAKDVYYFKDWPRKGSDMQKLFNIEEYFLPNWRAQE